MDIGNSKGVGRLVELVIAFVIASVVSAVLFLFGLALEVAGWCTEFVVKMIKIGFMITTLISFGVILSIVTLLVTAVL